MKGYSTILVCFIEEAFDNARANSEACGCVQVSDPTLPWDEDPWQAAFAAKMASAMCPDRQSL